MRKITISPEEFKKRIEEYFETKGLSAELFISAYSQTDNQINSIRINGTFNKIRMLEFDIFFNRQYEPVLRELKGICPVSELAEILQEFQIAIEKI